MPNVRFASQTLTQAAKVEVDNAIAESKTAECIINQAAPAKPTAKDLYPSFVASKEASITLLRPGRSRSKKGFSIQYRFTEDYIKTTKLYSGPNNWAEKIFVVGTTSEAEERARKLKARYEAEFVRVFEWRVINA